MMYDFHYNYIKSKYGDRAKLLFSDKDTLIYEIEAEDVYKYFWNDKDMFDKTTKGIKKNVIKNNIKHEDYKNVLLNNEQLHHKMRTTGSRKHQLGSYKINKVSLSCFDDKCYIHDNGISSYTYGHYKME